MEVILLLLAGGGIVWFLWYKRTEAAGEPSPPQTYRAPAPSSRYKLSNAVGIVASAQRYDRSNQFGYRFQGTTLHLRDLLSANVVPISYEALYDFADVGERVDTILAEQDLMGIKSVLPVAALNRSTREFHHVLANQKKVAAAEDPDLSEITKEIEFYARHVLNVNMAS